MVQRQNVMEISWRFVAIYVEHYIPSVANINFLLLGSIGANCQMIEIQCKIRKIAFLIVNENATP